MHRHPGSSGPSADPAHTRKGIRKPGQYGNARITVRNLKVVRVDAQTTFCSSGGRPRPQRRLPDGPPDEQGVTPDRSGVARAMADKTPVPNPKYQVPC